jgi:hypothetical protein
VSQKKSFLLLNYFPQVFVMARKNWLTQKIDTRVEGPLLWLPDDEFQKTLELDCGRNLEKFGNSG